MGKSDLILRVKVLPDYHLRVLMGSGQVVELDFLPLLSTNRFFDLKKLGVFERVRVEGDFLVFGNGFKMGASEIQELVMNPRRWNCGEVDALENW